MFPVLLGKIIERGHPFPIVVEQLRGGPETFLDAPRLKHRRIDANPTVRLRTGAAKRFKKVKNATAVIWKTLLVAEKTFRKLDAPELLSEVAEGAVYMNGLRIKGRKQVPA